MFSNDLSMFLLAKDKLITVEMIILYAEMIIDGKMKRENIGKN